VYGKCPTWDLLFKEMRLDQNPTVRPAHPNELEADILTPTSLVTAAGLTLGMGIFWACR
jgi:hypothetical protein